MQSFDLDEVFIDSDDILGLGERILRWETFKMVDKEREPSKLLSSHAGVVGEVKAPVCILAFGKILQFRRISNFFTENTNPVKKQSPFWAAFCSKRKTQLFSHLNQ